MFAPLMKEHPVIGNRATVLLAEDPDRIREPLKAVCPIECESTRVVRGRVGQAARTGPLRNDPALRHGSLHSTTYIRSSSRYLVCNMLQPTETCRVAHATFKFCQKATTALLARCLLSSSLRTYPLGNSRPFSSTPSRLSGCANCETSIPAERRTQSRD